MLVVTLIVLLILAGMSIALLTGENGIINKARQAKVKNSEAEAREKLEITLNDAQMIKKTEGLTDEQLSNKIKEVGEELEDKKQVIVDGYIFEIDRSVPQIVDYVGPADGIIIIAIVSGNDGWVKPSDTGISITGKIKTYSSGRITNCSATKDGKQISEFSIGEDGSYVISNITEDTTVVINAEDSKGKTSSKTIQVQVKVDNIPPTVDGILAEADVMTIKISAEGTDNETGIKHFNYTISPTDGIPTDKVSGIFLQGETVEIITTATEQTKYKIAITATDNSDNISTKKIVEVTTENSMTLAEAKEKINSTNLKDYIGMKIRDYTPEAGGVWRVFYYDDKGYFGTAKTLYIKTDASSIRRIQISKYSGYSASEEGISMMKKMNPKWRNSSYSVIDLENERQVSWLCDTKNWMQYKNDEANFAIGAPSVEMYVRAYNIWKQNNIDGNALICKIGNSYGYSIGSDGKYNSNEASIKALESGPNGVFNDTSTYSIVASPSCYNERAVVLNASYGFSYAQDPRNYVYLTPIIGVIVE